MDGTNLPGMSGIEALKVLRANPLTARIPVIAVSANAVPFDIHKGMQAGFFGYVTKPIQLTQLMVSLMAALLVAQRQDGAAAPSGQDGAGAQDPA